MLKKTILHINLLVLIPRKREVDAQFPLIDQSAPEIFVKIVVRAMPLAKEKPALAGAIQCLALLHKRTKRGDSSAGANHDDRRLGVFGQGEASVGMDIDRQAAFMKRSEIAQEMGADTRGLRMAPGIAMEGDSQMNFIAYGFLRRSDRIKTGHQGF